MIRPASESALMDWTQERILVTGASGFLGSRLIRRLVDLGARVEAWASSPAHLWRLADIRDRIALSLVDIRDADRVRAACGALQPNLVYHLAAYGVHAEEQEYVQAVDVNVRGTVNLLEGLKGTPCRLVVTTGTWAEYGGKDHPIRESDPLEPVGVYGATKAASTLVAVSLAAQRRLPLIVLRPFSVYGPGEGGGKFVPSIIRACLKGENPRLSSCRQIRDYLFIDDMVEAYVKAAGLTVSAPLVLNVASGVPLRLEDFARRILRHFPGKRPEFGAVPDRQGEIWNVQADITKAKAIMQWQPSWSLEEGIRTTIEWFKSQEGHVH
ncbi:MAG: NAD(P)-dependent oxidoreductase [Nitrospira sp.]|nr:NAD(P)-dependent oxidoreductase [Nitrospira sp.]